MRRNGGFIVVIQPGSKKNQLTFLPLAQYNNPVARRKFYTLGNVVGTHEIYSAIVRTVAKEQQVPLVDLDKKSQALLQNVGDRLLNYFTTTLNRENILIILRVFGIVLTLMNWVQEKWLNLCRLK